ncbi:ArsC family reductase [Spongiibacter sp. KMU-158]|uniref:ArsC family reductase n=1 Tax=Spongiibacter pelagi TaxID=2760804 RepID=A0A927C1E2_9GAMM|nr:ArsC family reductase [Spongiibacter pelagi]MBD2858247.1 ArsC family reductase [Spongiibacter pelagi]
MSSTLYGIKNCDTVKAARKWLETQNIDYVFHDLRDNPIAETQWNNWLSELGLDLVNKRSTTWKQLDETQRNSLTEENAAPLLAANPTLMKRPLLDTGSARHIGFKAEQYQQLFAQHTL